MKRPIDPTPFDRARVPPKQNLLIMPLLWLWCWLATRPGRLRIHKVGMKGLKPPFLVLGTHHAFMDFYVTPLCLFPHRANYVSELEGFENFGEWPYRQIGCLGTRKFVNDLALVKNIRRCMERRGILVLYPEARYANVGTSSELPASVGKLIQYLKVPVVVLQMRGNYLQSPIWNLKRRRGVRLEATLSRLFTAEEAAALSAGAIQEAVQRALSYDEYAWQAERHMAVRAPWRAEGLELPLYRCADCGTAFHMASRGAELFCTACGARWRMDEYGRLEGAGRPARFPHIPDWYEWERTQVEAAIEGGTYGLDQRVHIESLPNAVNFIDLGEGRLRHDGAGFALTLTDYGEQAPKTLRFPPGATFSIHTEYDYRGKGPCITLSTPDNTYFIYPLEPGFNPTELQFAAEALYRRAMVRGDRPPRRPDGPPPAGRGAPGSGPELDRG